MKSRIIIGVDQSYTDTGITAIKDKHNILFVRSLKRSSGQNHTEYRNMIYSFFERKLENLKKITDDITVIVERISIRAGKGGLSQSYVKSTAALIATIIDICSLYDVPVYSVDTRAWKSLVVGTCKPLDNIYGINPLKYPTIDYIHRSGLLKYIVEEYSGKGRKGVIRVFKRSEKAYVNVRINDNLADSICIALYGFFPDSRKKLQEEKF